MELARSINDDFLTLFYKEIECDVDDTNSKLNLHVLRIENNQFIYPQLVEKLYDALIPFSLSRSEIDRLKKGENYGQLFVKATQKFRNYKSNDGEAGELLLYCFLESHLKAPKILTKLEIKQNSDDYAKGSDGIHLLKISDKKYQLIFGESKLDAKLTTSITEAFKSIHNFINRDKSNINHEIGLINTQLCKEALDDNLYEFIKSIIFPKVNEAEAKTKDNAFAIFVGFDIKITNDEKKLNNDKFRDLIKDRIKKEVESKKEHIKKKINEYSLQGYSFYIYAFPFIDLDENRRKIIKDLTLS